MSQALGNDPAAAADFERLPTRADLWKVGVGVVAANVALTAVVIRLLV